MKTILIVDDEPSMIEILGYNLRKEGYATVSAKDGTKALEAMDSGDVSLVVLDVMMPGMDGFDVCREIRKKSDVPIIMLTAKSAESSKVVGLELGADDYVTKPFSIPELLARIKAVLRRTEKAESRQSEDSPEKETLVRGGLVIDRRRREVVSSGNKADLTTLEFDLLCFFAVNPGVVYSRSEILDHVWGTKSAVVDRAVDVHIRHLREKIEPDPETPKYIQTVRGAGYRFES